MRTYCHAGKLGDCIYALPAIRALGGGKLFLLKNRPGHQVFEPESLLPLLEQQPYLAWATVVDYAHQVQPDPPTDYSFLAFSTHPRVFQQHLVKTAYDIVGLDWNPGGPPPWLTAVPNSVADVVVSKTDHNLHGDAMEAYRRVPLSRAVFLGKKVEHEQFCAEFGRIDYLPTNNLLSAASVIAGCKAFIGNPSALLAVAVGLGKPCVAWSGMLLNALPFAPQRFSCNLFDAL
jgi:hypothetical protein